MQRLNVFERPDGVLKVTVGLGRGMRFNVTLFPDGCVRVMDTSRTVLGRVVGLRSAYGERFNGSADAKDALAAVFS